MKSGGSHGRLTIGSSKWELDLYEADNLLPVFLDGMYQRKVIPKQEYYPSLAEDAERGAQLIEVHEFKASGQVIADRLDLMGYDQVSIIDFLNKRFEELGGVRVHGIDPDGDLLSELDGRRWVELVRSSRTDLAEDAHPSLDNQYWLFSWLSGESFRLILRAYLLAFPDSEVILDVTELQELWWETLPGPASLPSSREFLDPIIVLTEGPTDAQFLREALEILYPHLTDLIRFLDYDQKPQSSAGQVVNTVRAFAAAGIANRVVAVVDNDTAGADAIRVLGQVKLPRQIKVIQYPDLNLAKEYPTLGPPTLDLPDGSIALADINGLAASIELYLGKDVLMQENGSLSPVQWRSFIEGMRRYQGEITNKRAIQEKFLAKCSLARQRGELIAGQDWEGMCLILEAIRETGSSLRR